MQEGESRGQRFGSDGVKWTIASRRAIREKKRMFFMKSSFCVYGLLLGRINGPQCPIMMPNNDKFCLQGEDLGYHDSLSLYGQHILSFIYYLTGNRVRLGWICFGLGLRPGKDCSRVHSVQLKLTLEYLWTKTGNKRRLPFQALVGRITELTWITLDTLCSHFF